MKGIEAVVVGLKDTLSANMAAKVAALNAEYGDYPLATIASYEFYEHNLPASAYPAAVIEGMDSVPETEWLGAETERHRIFLTIWESGTDALELEFKMMRYARAVKEILTTNQVLAGTWHGLSIETTQYSPMLSEDKRYFKCVRLIIHILREETA